MHTSTATQLTPSATLSQIYDASHNHFASIPGQVAIAADERGGINFLSHEVVVHQGLVSDVMSSISVALEIVAAPDKDRPVAGLQVHVRNTEDGISEAYHLCLDGDLEAEVGRFNAEIVDIDGHADFASLAEAAIRNRFSLYAQLAHAVDADQARSPAKKALKTFNVSIFTEVRVSALEVKSDSPQAAHARAGELCFHEEVRGRSQANNNGCFTTAAEWTEGAPLAAVVDFVADGEVDYELSLNFDEQGHADLSKLKWLWSKFSEVATNQEDGILESFLHFRAGTHCEDVWHWFEQSNPLFSVAEMMGVATKPEAARGPMATLERRIVLVDSNDLLGIHYRKVHQDQSIEILDLLANDQGMAPGFDYREDGHQVLLFAEDELTSSMSDEQLDFVQRGWANMEFAGAVWVVVIRTNAVPGSNEVIGFTSRELDVAKAFCEELNASR